MVTEAQNKAQKKWAKNNTDKVNAINKRWRQNHKKQFSQIIIARRKEVSNELKAKGMMFTYYSKTYREKKNIEYLVKKLHINEDEARQLLVDNDWNTKKILETYLK